MTARRQRLEQLAGSWVPPLQLTPVTDDLDEARDWFEVLPGAMGVEGLVVKGAASRYAPGRRDAWVKVNSVGLRGVRFSFDAWMCLVSVLPRTGFVVRDRCRGWPYGCSAEIVRQPIRWVAGFLSAGSAPCPAA